MFLKEDWIGIIVSILFIAAVAVGIYLWVDYQTDRKSQVWNQQAVIKNFTH